jgi:hypothetical protein
VSVETVPADLSDSANVTRLARQLIDILVNNAGAIPGGKLLDIDEATWRAAWDLKVFGYINMCRTFYALMKARQAGVIINGIGNAAQTHDPVYICGVAGNAALTAFTQSLGSVSVRDGETPLPRTSASSNSAAIIARSRAARSSFAVSSDSSIPALAPGSRSVLMKSSVMTSPSGAWRAWS